MELLEVGIGVGSFNKKLEGAENKMIAVGKSCSPEGRVMVGKGGRGGIPGSVLRPYLSLFHICSIHDYALFRASSALKCFPLRPPSGPLFFFSEL